MAGYAFGSNPPYGLDNLIERGLDPKVPRLFILDGAKALSKAVRATFGRQTLIQRCQGHKARKSRG
jgi:putative transposase